MTEQAVNTTETNTQTAQPATPAIPASFDGFLADQPEPIKDLFDKHIDGLKSALDKERADRKTLEKELRTLGKQAEKGSDLETQLNKLADDVKKADSRAEFFKGAHDAGVKNLTLAWAASKEYDVLDRNGNVDFDKLKAVAPELFAMQTTPAKVPPTNAGAGAGQGGANKPDMNNFLRRAAGR